MDISLSSLQHYVYCPRQCALIHLEQQWVENIFTAEGRNMHEKVHSSTTETRGERKIVTGLQIGSESLGVFGQADVVEFHRQCRRWQPYPVEYKRGRPKNPQGDKIQLCAQAMCLEEMLGVDIAEGALFYGKTRRRLVVSMDTALREQTRETIKSVQDLLSKGVIPSYPSEALIKVLCPCCSLVNVCLPQTSQVSASRYLQALMEGL